MRAIWTCAVTVRYYESSINRSIRLGSGWEFLGTCNRSRAFFVRDSAFQESHSRTNSSKAQSKVALHTFRKSYHASQSCQAPCIMCQFTHFLLIVRTVWRLIYMFNCNYIISTCITTCVTCIFWYSSLSRLHPQSLVPQWVGADEYTCPYYSDEDDENQGLHVLHTPDHLHNRNDSFR